MNVAVAGVALLAACAIAAHLGGHPLRIGRDGVDHEREGREHAHEDEEGREDRAADGSSLR